VAKWTANEQVVDDITVVVVYFLGAMYGMEGGTDSSTGNSTGNSRKGAQPIVVSSTVSSSSGGASKLPDMPAAP
jgi:hypothetical protein